jgi:hypothetical protein
MNAIAKTKKFPGELRMQMMELNYRLKIKTLKNSN